LIGKQASLTSNSYRSSVNVARRHCKNKALTVNCEKYRKASDQESPTVMADMAERLIGAVFVTPAGRTWTRDMQRVTRLVWRPALIVVVVRLTESPAVERRIHYNTYF